MVIWVRRPRGVVWVAETWHAEAGRGEEAALAAAIEAALGRVRACVRLCVEGGACATRARAARGGDGANGSRRCWRGRNQGDAGPRDGAGGAARARRGLTVVGSARRGLTVVGAVAVQRFRDVHRDYASEFKKTKARSAALTFANATLYLY